MSRSDDGPLTWGKMPSPEVPGAGSGLEITAELLDECMDRVARAIVRDEINGTIYLPIYDRLGLELANVRRQVATLDEVRERVRRSPDLTRKTSR